MNRFTASTPSYNNCLKGMGSKGLSALGGVQGQSPWPYFLHPIALYVRTISAAKLLANAVTSQASVLVYQDGFSIAALGALGCLVFVAMMRRGPPSPF